MQLLLNRAVGEQTADNSFFPAEHDIREEGVTPPFHTLCSPIFVHFDDWLSVSLDGVTGPEKE